eukprot:TRINITY_DN19624_c0_g1_i1.p1 TRINITY_DN19624_c0_g1~~TRINITY_DN19624_c0_g1_i1.p1  ORF type:complete len:516 (+),score=77.36 TRINITY_DN19624_c0_g1_i1:38-1585(+)
MMRGPLAPALLCLCACLLPVGGARISAGGDVVVAAVAQDFASVDVADVATGVAALLNATGSVEVVGVVRSGTQGVSQLVLAFKQTAAGESGLSLAQRFMQQATVVGSPLAVRLQLRGDAGADVPSLAACGAAGITADGLRHCTLPGTSDLSTEGTGCRLLDLRSGIAVVSLLVATVFGLMWVLLLLLSRSGKGDAPAPAAAVRAHDERLSSRSPTDPVPSDATPAAAAAKPSAAPVQTYSSRGSEPVTVEPPAARPAKPSSRPPLVEIPPNAADAGVPAVPPPPQASVKAARVGSKGQAGRPAKGPPQGPVPRPPSPQFAPYMPAQAPPLQLQEAPRDFSYIPDRIDSPELHVGDLVVDMPAMRSAGGVDARSVTCSPGEAYLQQWEEREVREPTHSTQPAQAHPLVHKGSHAAVYRPGRAGLVYVDDAPPRDATPVRGAASELRHSSPAPRATDGGEERRPSLHRDPRGPASPGLLAAGARRDRDPRDRAPSVGSDGGQAPPRGGHHTVRYDNY